MNESGRAEDLVSVIVITYNSGQYVLETLNSIKNQSYQNLELIVSDDSSTDSTVPLCEAWLKENSYRFVKTSIIKAPRNTGISANCNRGLYASKGDWIKIIAGDDVLLKDCISDNIRFVENTPEAYILHSNRLDYQDTFEEENFVGEYSLDNTPYGAPQIGAAIQYKILLRQVFISAPTVFAKRSLLVEMNGFDEQIPMIEDWPMWLKVTSSGYKIYYLNKATVKYRLHSTSASSLSNKTRLFSRVEEMKELVYKHYIYPHITFTERALHKYNFFRMRLFNLTGMNKGYKLCRFINKATGIPVLKYSAAMARLVSKP